MSDKFSCKFALNSTKRLSFFLQTIQQTALLLEDQRQNDMFCICSSHKMYEGTANENRWLLQLLNYYYKLWKLEVLSLTKHNQDKSKNSQFCYKHPVYEFVGLKRITEGVADLQTSM